MLSLSTKNYRRIRSLLDMYKTYLQPPSYLDPLKTEQLIIKCYVIGTPMEAREWVWNQGGGVETPCRYKVSIFREREREREREKRRLEETHKVIHGLSDLFRFDYILGSTLLLRKIFPVLFKEIFLVSKSKGNQNVSVVHL